MSDEFEIDSGTLGPENRAPRPIVAIVGRPNVGKSTLFNRLVGRRRALVEDLPGVTRDRNYGDTVWDGRAFTAVDTGGFLPETEDRLLQQVRDQALLAVEEAEAVILVVDGLSGLTAADQEVARLLRRSGKPVFLAVNKLDSSKREENEFFAEFFRLGIEQTFPISAEHGRGLGDLLDALVASFPRVEPAEEEAGEEDVVRVAIVGRPNVGKSTFVNRLLGEERFVASDIPGTTRDSVDARLEHEGRTFVLTDTAGIRRKKTISARVEQFSVMRSLHAIERADVVILMMDANEAAVDQDARIADIANQKGKALIVVVNKWDVVPGKRDTEAYYREEIGKRLPFVSYAPMVFASAKTGSHVFKALSLAAELFEQYRARVPTPVLNQFLKTIVDEHPAPRASGGHPVRLFYIAQIASRPPTFALASNRPSEVAEDYKRFIVNRMRDAFGLRVPIRLIFREKSKRQYGPKKQETRRSRRRR